MKWIQLALYRGQLQILVKMVVNVRSEVLIAVNMKITVFWNLVPCTFVIIPHKIVILMAMNLRGP